MKINKYDRPRHCKHCGKEYNQGKSNQKFCKTSCRVSNWQMNNPKKAGALEGVKDKPQVNSGSTFEEILKIALATGGVAAVKALFEKLGGVHNSDIKKQLDWLVEDAKLKDKKLEELLKMVNFFRQKEGLPVLPLSFLVAN